MAERNNLIEMACPDGVTYAIRYMAWDLEKAKAAFDRYMIHQTLSDDIPKTFDGFLVFVMAGGSLWFEVVDIELGQQIGLMHVNGLSPSLVEKRYISAQFHAITWDAKAAYRLNLVKAFIRWLFTNLKLHRLQAEIPPKFGGAIRTLLKVGFTSEGRLRQARRYGGEWYDVVVLGVLEQEVDSWEIE